MPSDRPSDRSLRVAREWLRENNSHGHDHCPCEMCEVAVAALLDRERGRGLAFPCANCGAIAVAEAHESIDSGTTLVCDECGDGTVIELRASPPPEVEG